MAKFIDNIIEKFASYLRDRNNLDYITYLKVKLGIQVAYNNISKGIVTYGISLLCNMFFYTLTVHITYFILKLFAHGAHAKSAILCHIQNIVSFILVPYLIVSFRPDSRILMGLVFLNLIILLIYAPRTTKKQPLPFKYRKGKKIKTMILATLILILSIFIKEPYSVLLLYSEILIGISQLPIFVPKEEYKG
ncbi:accessory gene regulator AgrB [Staphylococcus pettenkoferi]|uniref:accessory gene regulator AgrB n=1 Tax=Staphylococcus pettenkoferi TaxID=170573 RepID=UPI0022740EBA|nr:accessory gene regulator AgrB [Staphylococcus pettenkoferi]MCY1621018.1 accessory gene regulator AgrB [Staphylococcus pettenkoferi]